MPWNDATLSLDHVTWLSWLWLGVLLLPLVPLALRRRGHPRPLPKARRTAAFPCRRALFRWPTRFRITLLYPIGATEPCASRGTGPAPGPQRIPATVLDISGGGLRVRVPQTLPRGTRVQIDPEYVGPFPLAGLHCRVVTSHQEGDQACLQLCFVHLPADTQARIVRRIYQHQLGIGLTNPMDPDRLRLRRRRGLYRRGPSRCQ